MDTLETAGAYRKLRRIIPFWPLFVLAGILILTVPLLHGYFTERVFYLNGHQYRLSESPDHLVRYRSSNSPDIEVLQSDEGITVTVGQETFVIQEQGDYQWRVDYPSGNWYRVEDSYGYGHFLTYDKFGEFVVPVSIYVDDERILREGEEIYHPASIISSAYPDYHITRGSPGLCILSFLLLILGWCTFRYEKFQTFLFHLNLYRIWVVDPEPTDFYYFMSKVSGIIIMGASVVLFFMSLN